LLNFSLREYVLNISLSDVCVPIRGVTYSNEDESKTGIKILRANNITLSTNQLNYDNVRTIRSDFPVSGEQRLKAGDILMSAASGSKEHVGKVALIPEDTDFYFGSFMMVLRVKTNAINPHYLFEYLSSTIFRGLLFRILGGTNINNLNFTMIKDFNIPLPSKKEQVQIVTVTKKSRDKAKLLEQEIKESIRSIDSRVLDLIEK
jgi:restriction endonuclease S subunit